MVSRRTGLTRLHGVLHLPSSPKELAQFVAVIAGCYLAGQLGLKVTMLHPPVSPVWPPTGVALAALLLIGYRAWLPIFISAFLVCLSAATPFHASAAIAFANTLASLAAAYLINRFAGGGKVFETPQNVFKFVLFACIISPAISTTMCLTYLYPAGVPQGPNIPLAWLTWFVGDSIGAFLFAPFLVTSFRYAHRLDNREAVELCFLTFGLIASCLTVFGPLSLFVQQKHLLQEWWCLPFLIWAGFRFCQVEVAGTTLLFFGLAIWGTFHGYGPFASPDSNVSLMVLAAFVAVTGTTTLAIAATLSERRHVHEGLLGLQSLLEATVQDKTRDLTGTVETLQAEVFDRMLAENTLRESNDRFEQLAATVSDVFWLMDIANMRLLYISPAYETIWGRSCRSLYADPHSWLDSVHPDDHERALTFFDQETKKSQYEAEYRIIRPNGDVRHIWDRGNIIRDGNGRVARIAGLATDITARKRLEEELQEAQKWKSERN